MRIDTLRLAAAIIVAGAILTAAKPAAEFEKITDHYYFAQSVEGDPNIGVIVTREGVLMIDPPGENDLQQILEAMGKITSSSVRWVVHTNYRRMQSSGYAYFLKQGAVLLNSAPLDRLAFPEPEPQKQAAGASLAQKPPESKAAPASKPARFVFENQLRLFPENLEVRIFAVKKKAITGGDVVVYIPSEKVLHTGELFIPGSFPAIDTQGGEGDALGWLEAMKQTIAAVPLLKSAMPPPKPELPPTPPELEKTPEEYVFVIPGVGSPSNLKEMKDLLESAQKLRTQVARAVALKRTLQTFLTGPGLDQFRSLTNFQTYAGQLYEALAAAK
jgi:glyoxylase-like metal-dependent hydrolase (beta-lactamase superfamily II)